MSEIKKSLEANMDFIRSQLPDDLREHAESCLDNCDVTQDSDDDLLKQQLVHNLPDELKAEVDENSILPASKPVVASLDEQKKLVLESLPDEFKADFEKNADNELSG